MIVAVDLGNSRVKFAFLEGGARLFAFAVSAEPSRTEDEWRLLLSLFCREKSLDPARAEGIVLASVSPAKTPALIAALESVFSKKVLQVGPGIRTGLDIRTDHQSELGADLVANCVGAVLRAKPPFIIADLGTALTLSVVDEKGVFRGVSIFPGLSRSARTLARDCANLPETSPLSPKGRLGKNTEDALSAGLIFGFAALLDGQIRRLQEELNLTNAALFACGGEAERILPYCETPFCHVPDLTLEGLGRIFELNRPPRRA